MATAVLGERMSKPENTGPDVPRGEAGRWLPGASPNPGGRPKKLVEMERALDDELRTPEQIRETLRALKRLALEGVTNDVFSKDGMLLGTKTTYSPAYMEMLLNRTLGPVKEAPIDLSDVPEEELVTLREKLRQ